MTIFTAWHREQFQRHGYVKVDAVIPRAIVEHVLQAVRDAYGLDIENPATWYTLPPENYNVVPLHHSQAQWDNRQHPRLYQTFCEFWGTDDLWVTMDRVSFQPPERASHPVLPLHWDMDPRADQGLVQALVYVTDVPEERGAFRGVPSIYAELEAWLAERTSAMPFHAMDFSQEPTTSVPGKAGDLIIWHPRLPHGPGRNVSSLPRVMQPLSLFPAPAGNVVEVGGGRWTRQEQVTWWREKRPPPWWRGLPLQRDPEPGAPARLTAIGRALVGLREREHDTA